MEKSPQKKKKILKIFVSIFLMLIAILAVIYFSLPFIIETIIFPIIAEKLGIHNAYLEVDKADINGLGISSLKIFGEHNTGVQVGSLKIKAEDAEIQSLQVNGLDLFFELQNGKLKIPGIETPEEDKERANTEIFKIPALIAPNFTLSVINSGLNLKIEKNGKIQTLKVPFLIKMARNENKISFSTKAEKFHYKDGKIDLSVPELKVEGEIISENNRMVISGIANFANIAFQAGKIKVGEIKGKIPFYFTVSKKGLEFKVPENISIKKGFLSIEKISFGKRSLGSANFSLFQKGKSFILDGVHTGLIKDRKTFIFGEITPPSEKKQLTAEILTKLNWKDLDLKLSEFHPKAGSATFKGNIDIQADLGFKNNRISAKSKVSVENGFLEDSDRDFSMEGISLSFELADALKLRSCPSQILSFSSLKFKTFALEKGKIWFQTESLKRYLVEKSQFKWGRGNVASNAFRIFADKPDEIDLILYCDRLNVADLLNQFHVGKASGEGTVSGKIPLDYKNNRILIDDGFLYTTPGIGGNISLTDFMGPLANISSGFQMAIAKEALEDFNYDWLRIRLNSEKEDLLLQLEMNGAPARLMPFGYDLKQGGLYKSDDPNTKAKFKGISFQINFRLPANQMLEYGTRFKEISGKLK